MGVIRKSSTLIFNELTGPTERMTLVLFTLIKSHTASDLKREQFSLNPDIYLSGLRDSPELLFQLLRTRKPILSRAGAPQR